LAPSTNVETRLLADLLLARILRALELGLDWTPGPA